MTPSWSEVNSAVMAVLSEFGRSKWPSVRSSNQARDVFVERLFSLRHAEAISEVDEVRIVAGTVVTPLAKDLLKRRKIAIQIVSRREAALARTNQKGEWAFAIDWRVGQIEAFRRMLLEDWSEVVDAAQWVIESEGRGALVVTDEASIATWRAGRVEGVRAASVVDPDGVSRAIRHLGANMIVVEPSGKSIYLLKQIGERFRQGGAPVIPEWLEAEAIR